MTRKFYEEPQILVMEMDEEEIIATSDAASTISNAGGNTESVQYHDSSSSFHKTSSAKTFDFGGDDSEESIW